MASLLILQESKYQEIPQVCIEDPNSVPVEAVKSSGDHCEDCLAISALLLGVLFFGFLAFECYLIVIAEPERQFSQFQIEQLSVSLHNLSDSHQIRAKWEIGVSMANLNTFNNLKFNEINMLVRYNHDSLSGVVIPPFRLGRETRTLQNATVLELWQERFNRVETLSVEVELRVDFKYEDWMSSINFGSHDDGKALCKNLWIKFLSTAKQGSVTE